jgi:hypothetical protein
MNKLLTYPQQVKAAVLELALSSLVNQPNLTECAAPLLKSSCFLQSVSIYKKISASFDCCESSRLLLSMQHLLQAVDMKNSGVITKIAAA